VCDGQANALAGAGDQRNFVFQPASRAPFGHA
jgi:hypothetical protein